MLPSDPIAGSVLRQTTIGKDGIADIVVELTDTLDRGRLPRLSLPPNYLAAKLASAVPVLSGEPIPLPVALLKPALVELCEKASWPIAVSVPSRSAPSDGPESSDRERGQGLLRSPAHRDRGRRPRA